MTVDRSKPNDDEVLAAIRNLFHLVAKTWKALLIGLVLGGVAGVVWASMQPPYYTASTALVASSAIAESGSSSSALSALSSLAGANNTSKELSPFERLQLVMQSAGLAKSLLSDETARETLFPGRWDAREKKWTMPHGIMASIRHRLGAEEIPEPDSSVALAALKSHLKISPDSSTGLTTVTFTAADRGTALYMLQLVLRRADDVVRHDYLQVAEGYSSYINDRLSSVTNVISRQVLMDQLSRYQQTVVMARVNLPFAELALDPPYVPQHKSGPSTLIYGAAGGFLGMVAAFILFGFSFRQTFPVRWLWRFGGDSVAFRHGNS